MKLTFPVLIPQWTHADLPAGEQAALCAAKAMLTYRAKAAKAAEEAARAAGKTEEEVKVIVAAARAHPPVPITDEGPLEIFMYTGEVFEVFDHGDGRWGVRLTRPSGPAGLPILYHTSDGVREGVTPSVGATFVAHHGAEYKSYPEVTTQNIRVECGVVRAEGRLDGHDEELKALRKTIKSLEADIANLRGEIKGLRLGFVRDTAEMRYDNPHEIRGRSLET